MYLSNNYFIFALLLNFNLIKIISSKGGADQYQRSMKKTEETIGQEITKLTAINVITDTKTNKQKKKGVNNSLI